MSRVNNRKNISSRRTYRTSPKYKIADEGLVVVSIDSILKTQGATIDKSTEERLQNVRIKMLAKKSNNK